MVKGIDPIKKIVELAATTPFAGRLYLVGGAVRDRLLDRPGPSDLDIACELDPEPFVNLLFRKGISAHPPVIFSRFGTARAEIDGQILEFATMRSESYEGQSRKPKVRAATIQEDANRRDFTVNALYQRFGDPDVIDPTGLGLNDLKARVLRTPCDPVRTFQDDPLRMLRAVRFRWKLGFDFADGVAEAIKEQSERLSIVSLERVRDELNGILALENGPQALEDLRVLNLLDQFLPELVALKGVDQGMYHHLDVWDHTRLVIQRLWELGTAEPVTILAALFHDVGKPRTRMVDEEGKVRFFGHESVGAEMTQIALRRMRYSESLIAGVSKLVAAHMRLGQFHEFGKPGIRRLMRDMGTDLGLLLNLIEADSLSLAPGIKPMPMAQIREKIQTCAKETPVAHLESPLTGTEIGEVLRIPAGRSIGLAKNYLLERVLAGDLSAGDKAAAKSLLLQAWPSLSDKSRKN